MASLLYYGGILILALALVFLFFQGWREIVLRTGQDVIKGFWLLVTLGLILATVGHRWKWMLCRCPKCRHSLLGWVPFFWLPSKYCPACGTEIVLCIDSKKEGP